MAGSDYTHATGTVTFAAGQTTATINLTVLGDSSVEGLEGFNVLLSNPQGLTIADGTSNVAINDDDVAPPPPLPSVSISNLTLTEGAAGANKTATLTLTLSAAATTATTVAWTTVAGSAAAGSDYVSASGTVTFAAGQTSATVVVTVIGDSTVEPNEIFTVTLSNPQGMTIGNGTGTVTITNDDVAPPPAPTIAIGDVTVTEGNKNATVTVTLTLSSASTTAISVTASTVAGTGAAGSDFLAKAGTVTFAAGQTTATFTVTIVGDRTREASEYFDVVLSAPTGGATIADGSGRVTINDDDARLLATAEGPGTQAPSLTVQSAQPALAAAIAAWIASGASAAPLAGITLRIESLDDLVLGYEDGKVIVLDADAAGWGWHTNPATAAPSNRIDLLTAIAHEIGHMLGLEHSATGLMKDQLAPGERILPPKRATAPAPWVTAMLAMLYQRAVANWMRTLAAQKAAVTKRPKAAKRCGKRTRKSAAKVKRGKCRTMKRKQARTRKGAGRGKDRKVSRPVG
jgi:hypothetical protein